MGKVITLCGTRAKQRVKRSLFSKIPGYASYYLHRLAHWRCWEPILVFESDDWGMERRQCLEFLKPYGQPANWADDQLESQEDLERLYQVLGGFSDQNGRPGCFTANFLVANPDFETIASDHFKRYYEIPIAQDKELKRKWLEGMERRVFFPQYHGRTHFWPEAWLKDLRSGTKGASELFAHRCHGGLSLLKKELWRYHSEYLDWKEGKELLPEQLLGWLRGGLDFFQQTFGFFPQSTIAPHYIFTPATSYAWHKTGIQFVQGANYHILRSPDGKPRVLSHVLGERSPEGLLYLVRTVKFEPRSKYTNWGLIAALRIAKACFRDHIPAVVDTHRANYTGSQRSQSLEVLKALISGLQPFRPYFLTTVELGEAIAKDGQYHDVWTGKVRHLTPLQQPCRKMLRVLFGRYNAFLVRKGRGSY